MIRILSFNACIMPQGVTNSGSRDDKKRERLQAFFEHISRDFDVLLLQEIWDCCWWKKWSSIVTEMACNNGFVYSHFTGIPFSCLINNGLLILSKHSFSETNSYMFRNSVGLQWFIPNGILHVKIKNIDLYVTHMHAGSLDTRFLNSDTVANKIQKAQLEELFEFVKKTGNHYIITGDFNMEQGDLNSLLSKCDFPITYPFPEDGSSYLVNKNFVGKRVSNINKNITIDVVSPEINGFILSDHKMIKILVDF